MGLVGVFGSIVRFVMGSLLVIILYRHINDMAAKESLLKTAVKGIDGYLVLSSRIPWLVEILKLAKNSLQSLAKSPLESYVWQVLQYSLALGFLNFRKQFLLHFVIISSVIVLNIPKSFEDAENFFADQAQNILILGLTGYVSSL